MGDHNSMSISVDWPSDETFNWGPLVLLLRRQYKFPFGINVVQFSIFNFSIFNDDHDDDMMMMIMMILEDNIYVIPLKLP